jgi:hypothetical protein
MNIHFPLSLDSAFFDLQFLPVDGMISSFHLDGAPFYSEQAGNR